MAEDGRVRVAVGRTADKICVTAEADSVGSELTVMATERVISSRTVASEENSATTEKERGRGDRWWLAAGVLAYTLLIITMIILNKILKR